MEHHTAEVEGRPDAGRRLSEDQRAMVAANMGLAGAVAGRCTRHRDDFDDMLSEAFVGLCTAALDFREDGGASFATFGYRRAFGRVLGYLKHCRRRGRRAYVAMTPCDPDDLAEILPSADDGPGAIEAHDRTEAIRRAIGRLRPSHREVIDARMRGETLDQIGRRMGTSRECVRGFEKRGRMALRYLLEGRDL